MTWVILMEGPECAPAPGYPRLYENELFRCGTSLDGAALFVAGCIAIVLTKTTVRPWLRLLGCYGKQASSEVC